MRVIVVLLFVLGSCSEKSSKLAVVDTTGGEVTIEDTCQRKNADTFVQNWPAPALVSSAYIKKANLALKKVRKQLYIEPGYFPTFEIKGDTLIDLNNDHYADLLVEYDENFMDGVTLNLIEAFLFDTRQNNFVRHPQLSSISNPIFDFTNHIIYSSRRYGCCTGNGNAVKLKWNSDYIALDTLETYNWELSSNAPEWKFRYRNYITNKEQSWISNKVTFPNAEYYFHYKTLTRHPSAH